MDFGPDPRGMDRIPTRAGAHTVPQTRRNLMRTPMRRLLPTACLLLTIPSCGRNDVDAPPPIVLGDSTCQECGMINHRERTRLPTTPVR